ncbi:OLC1v1038858C2 [Oldenlandia corymbosa var. corymbosa]|uniref:OLC1v1038858C2 n=1 Tax=Oldenlandia corymbosa var. corymbosa TaxID=529605 RepID=A0AAV1D3V8_OLDCO|nr:OLC1v1038858C2 [Oldenlandia corymbosa var. corymbosa]
MKKRGRKPIIDKTVDSEDWCFRCKEGGDLLICDYKQCIKTYHPHCVDESLTSKKRFHCERHRCWQCRKGKTSFHCYCCPKAVCLRCINPVEFVRIKGQDGFCCDCLNLVLLIEENRDVTADGVTVDFKDLQTYEGLFMDYYFRVMKEKIGLTVEDLHTAKDKLMTGKYELDDFIDEEDGEMESDYEATDSEEVFKPTKKRKFKNDLQVKKPKKAKSKEMQFSGWGSTRLIQFLASVGEDTSKEIPQRKVDTLINLYVNKNKLFDPNDKKKIRCDEKLLALFGREVLKRNKIYELLECHFANDLVVPEQDEDLEEENTFDGTEDGSVSIKMRRSLKKDKDPMKVKQVSNVPESCFAAICAENIKHVYLRRSLLQELSKEPELFEQKVKGSFIRLKTDPNDRFQRNSHQLLQVTGVKKTSSGQSNAEMVLQVSNMPFEIRIGSLSDADIEEAECADLRQKVKDGLIPKPTVVELQEKARSLHEDVTKNWITRELKLLDSRINQANDKEELALLSEENEFNRKEDEASPQSVISTGLKGKWGNNGTSRGKKYPGQNFVSPPLPISADQGSTWKSTTTVAATVERSQDQVLTPESQYKGKFLGEKGMHSPFATYLKQNQGTNTEQPATRRINGIVATTVKGSPGQVQTSESQCKGKFLGEEGMRCPSPTNFKHNQGGTYFERASTRKSHRTVAVSATLKESTDEMPTSEDHSNERFQVKEIYNSSSTKLKQNEAINTEDMTPEQQGTRVDKAVVDLSSDDDSVVCTGSLRKQKLKDPDGSLRKQKLEDPDSRVWLVVGPDGERKGTYTLSLLKAWREASPYALKFKVWKETQTEEQAIWLGDAIKLAFDEN